MSSSESGSASYPASPPLESAQHQEDKVRVEEDRLAFLGEQSPRSHDPSTETQIVEDALPDVTIDDDDDTSSGSDYTPEPHTLDPTDQVPSSPNAGNDAFSSGPPSRPNKYNGPPSTWRNWTAAERELAASLQQLTAIDLSVHLYNAVHLQSRPRKLREQGAEQHERSVGAGDAWLPPKVWTAWPMPPDIVPREADISRWEEERDRPRQYYGRIHTLSITLKELLVGHVLKKAKERFWAREWEDDEPNIPDEKPRRKLKSRSGQSGDGSEDLDLSSPDTENTGRVRSSSARSEADDHGEQSPSAEASLRAENTTEPLNGHLDQNPSDVEPELMVDDDKASDILEPTLNHIVAKFDNLLMGLHHARSAYMALEDSASESQIDVRQSRQSSRRKRKRSKPRQERRRPRSFGESLVESELDIAEYSRATSRSQTRSQRTSSSSRKAQSFRDRKTRSGLRDWSDILGIASMTGWESAVVEKAASRCAALFEEGISFRTLAEGTDKIKEVSYLPGIPKQSKIRRLGKGSLKRARDASDAFDPILSDEELAGVVHMDSLLHPVEAERHWKRNKNLRHSRRRSP